ncbi:MAG: hypothetical protein FWH00_02370, partial [Oscillospiraceae bacterium]|nr:hypothetical protein [Oscillospiraceae bacterium]
LFMKNSVMAVNDSASALESWHLARTLRGIPGTIEDDCNMIDQITARDIADIANAVTLDTVYLLSGKEGASDE